MKQERKTRRRSEKGIALLIAIFVLLLVSVVAIALLVSSGTETALGANYRSSSTVYYGALAGLEEARGRLLPKNPGYFGASVPALAYGTTLPLYTAIYVLNQLPGETVTPWDSSDKYYDNEYANEFGVSASTNSSVLSVWNNSPGGTPGPVYKWVRVNAATEVSLHLDVDQDGTFDPTPVLFYDPAHLDFNGNPWPSMIVSSTPPSTAAQVLELTALAALPNGTKKILQYLVAATGPTTPSEGAPMVPSLSFPSALTMDGNNVTFSVPSSAAFLVNGTDQNDPLNPLPNGCTPGATAVSAVGYTNTGDASHANIIAAIPVANVNNYSGVGGSTPNVSPVVGVGGLASSLETVSGMNLMVQAITQNADVVINGPATQSDMPAAMSLTNPMTIVVNGDLTFNGWHATGYGILLVTGKFTYDPDASWDGIVLVIGTGEIYSHQAGTGKFYGAMLVANTVGGAGNQLGPSSFDFTSGAGSDGIYYSSCWVNYVQAPVKYKVLSFHEIPQ